MNNSILLDVVNLKKHFPIRTGVLKKITGHVKAVDDVSFQVFEGETLGLVGESGCGKTTTGRMILNLINPTDGTINFNSNIIKTKNKTNINILELSPTDLKKVRQEMQIIFQDPYSSLNPRMTVGSLISEPLVTHKKIQNKRDLKKRILEILNSVGLSDSHINRFPHEFSGGQRQRIGIARAIALSPKLIVADEPVSALDVSIQAQVINLLKSIQNELNISFLFIAHDLSVIKYISDRIAVMYLGKIVELCTKDELFNNPKHPYTEALISSIPIPNPKHKKNKIILEGDVPSPSNPPTGCHFHTRCKYAKNICRESIPFLKNINNKNDHYVSCHLSQELKLSY